MPKLVLNGVQHDVDRLPERCPICHHAIDPRCLHGVIRSSQPLGETLAEASFQCPRPACLRLFVGRYRGQYSPQDPHSTLALGQTVPREPEPPVHSPEVLAISPEFVETYRQASAAETWGLGQVAGCGYRRALEFLVKDYSIGQDPASAEVIKHKPLASVIADHVRDEGVKLCAQRAAWLGNDQTHYVQRWVNHDVQDLKQLIALAASWITTSERTKAYLGKMPKP